MSKYQNKFYVGELFITSLINEPKIENMELLKNGAIDLRIGNLPVYIDYNKGIEYSRVLTIFLEDGEKFKCLHNQKYYTIDGTDNCCKNLIPLEYLLPSIGGIYKNYLILEEALYIFQLLFKKGLFLNQEKLFNNNKVLDMDRLFVGNLRLCTGVHPKYLEKDIYKFVNLERKLMLYKSDADLISLEAADKESVTGNIEATYDQEVFKTLFLDYSNRGFYNLHNFDYYEKVPSVSSEYSFEESRCGDLKPLQEVLETHKIGFNGRKISVPKALKLYRKIK